jgi:hypothetical protein
MLLVPVENCTVETTQSCPVKQHPQTMKRSYAGRYVNPSGGFDVLIPRDLVGRDVDNPSCQRGFTILFHDPAESLSVKGEPNSLDWNDARKATEANSNASREDGRKITFSKGYIFVLDGRQASSITTSYICRGPVYGIHRLQHLHWAWAENTYTNSAGRASPANLGTVKNLCNLYTLRGAFANRQDERPT